MQPELSPLSCASLDTIPSTGTLLLSEHSIFAQWGLAYPGLTSGMTKVAVKGIFQTGRSAIDLGRTSRTRMSTVTMHETTYFGSVML